MKNQNTESTIDNERGQLLDFRWSSLSIKEIRGILNALPFDLNFIDKNNLVQYYNESPGKVHKRNPEIFGNCVLDCHSEASKKKAMATLSALKSGKKDMIQSKGEAFGRPALWKYMAVRDSEGNYLGAICTTEYIDK